MGFWSDILSSLNGRGSALYTPRVTYLGASELAAALDPSQMTAAQMWSTQPHFRTVVTFIARNIAQLGLHTFERVGETDRRRDRSSILARSLADVDGHMTTFELVFALVGDLALYDRAYWWVAPSSELPSGWMIRRLPPTWVEPVMATPWEVKEYRAFIKKDGGFEVIKPEFIVAFPGYNPTRSHGCSPTVDALRQTLQEQVEASLYRSQVWKRGGRVSAVLERPKDAPQWSDPAREAFREDWYSKFTGRGSKAGGTPILEDGMTLKRIDFNAQEQQFVEAAKLSLVTVAAAFHVNPTMIGQNDGANYSNVREFRKMLYGDTLGPLIAQIESRINTFLVPRMGLDSARTYVEFNIDEKLQGNFEEQTTALQAATGGPWMTRNEARSLRNLPAIDGGDDLIIPLNVITGGQASPVDSGTQNRNAAPSPRVKAGPDENEVDQFRKVLTRFFGRQRAAVLSALGAKAPQWWDEERWNRELGEDLFALFVSLSSSTAQKAIEAAGGNSGAFDIDRLVDYLRAKASGVAEEINGTTLEQIEAALSDDEGDPAHVFEVAESQRVGAASLTLATTVAGFATVEAAKQTGGASKTWMTTSSNPRASHARMDGETVAIENNFSNGMKWPGDSSDADEVAGCACVVSFNYP